jgi:peptide chain release factor subunit 1
MAAPVTRETLRDLAAFRDPTGCAVSIYVDLDPSSVPTIPDMQTKFSALLAEAEKEAEGRSASRECRLALRDALARIRAFWNGELERDGAHGFAIFAAGGDGYFRALPLAAPVGDSVEISPTLHLEPLAGVVEREQALVAVVSRERGTLYELDAGGLREVADESEEQPGQHDQGGWSQARYQRHIDHLVHRHLKTVGGELDRRLRGRGVRLVIVGPEEMRGEFEGALASETRAAILGWTTVEAHAGPPAVLAAVRPLLDEARARASANVLARWQEEHGRGGRATGGWTETLRAASDARVDALLLSEGANRRVWQCPRCGRASTGGGACPLDGTALEERADGADVAIHQVLVNAGDLVRVGRGPLDGVDGIAALLRFSF